jgi:hypothetical protein
MGPARQRPVSAGLEDHWGPHHPSLAGKLRTRGCAPSAAAETRAPASCEPRHGSPPPEAPNQPKSARGSRQRAREHAKLDSVRPPARPNNPDVPRAPRQYLACVFSRSFVEPQNYCAAAITIDPHEATAAKSRGLLGYHKAHQEPLLEGPNLCRLEGPERVLRLQGRRCSPDGERAIDRHARRHAALRWRSGGLGGGRRWAPRD